MKKILVIGLSSSALVTVVVGTAGIHSMNIQTFATNRAQTHYTAVIDKNNRLIPVDANQQRFAFRLHNGEEYGFAYASDYIEGKPRYLDWENENYAFTWTRSRDNDHYFEIFLEEETREYYVDGQKKILRGFPGAYKITAVYTMSSPTLNVTERASNYGWTRSVTTVDGVTTSIETKTESATADGNTWCLRDNGTLYFHSITIEYYCPI